MSICSQVLASCPNKICPRRICFPTHKARGELSALLAIASKLETSINAQIGNHAVGSGIGLDQL
jgi:hypothetical protein